MGRNFFWPANRTELCTSDLKVNKSSYLGFFFRRKKNNWKRHLFEENLFSVEEQKMWQFQNMSLLAAQAIRHAHVLLLMLNALSNIIKPDVRSFPLWKVVSSGAKENEYKRPHGKHSRAQKTICKIRHFFGDEVFVWTFKEQVLNCVVCRPAMRALESGCC